MIDLHLHLDGSLDVDTILYLAQHDGVALPAWDAKGLRPYITAVGGKGLSGYLRCFDLPLRVLQTPFSLTYAVSNLIERLDVEGMRYAEIRFAPQLHTQNGMSQREAVEAALRGVEQGVGRSRHMRAQLILCCMRGAENQLENEQTVRLAGEYLGSGVVAVDLAGAEGEYPTADYRALFAEAARFGIPFTIHAGEADGAQSVRAAVEFGARRIGHGIRMCEDEDVMELVIEQGIALELCPSSNIQTGAVHSLREYPIRRFLKAGVIATVNTDNRTVSGTTIKKELALLRQGISLTAEEEKMLLLNAIYASFLPEEEKQTLSEQIYVHGCYV